VRSPRAGRRRKNLRALPATGLIGLSYRPCAHMIRVSAPNRLPPASTATLYGYIQRCICRRTASAGVALRTVAATVVIVPVCDLAHPWLFQSAMYRLPLVSIATPYGKYRQHSLPVRCRRHSRPGGCRDGSDRATAGRPCEQYRYGIGIYRFPWASRPRRTEVHFGAARRSGCRQISSLRACDLLITPPAVTLRITLLRESAIYRLPPAIDRDAERLVQLRIRRRSPVAGIAERAVAAIVVTDACYRPGESLVVRIGDIQMPPASTADARRVVSSRVCCGSAAATVVMIASGDNADANPFSDSPLRSCGHSIRMRCWRELLRSCVMAFYLHRFRIHVRLVRSFSR